MFLKDFASSLSLAVPVESLYTLRVLAEVTAPDAEDVPNSHWLVETIGGVPPLINKLWFINHY